MRVLVGTSGYSYAEWKGTFYPEDLPASKMLRYYGERFPTVEANGTFYRMPSEKALAGWTKQVPEEFVFAVKAPQRITHQLRLVDAGDALGHLCSVTEVLGARRGPFLFQLPPFLKKDLSRLTDFLALLPAGVLAAFEFRHATWFDDETYAALRARNAALVISESEKLAAPVVATADWGYLRLRREDYVDADLASWSERISAQPWQRAFVYLKHEESGMGPRLAARLTELLAR
ncbi:MAG: DUF72 domain-containing protein [Polyangia bacterium]|jgi:uncharacterized protein YecE (DUF72 family)